MYSNLEEGQVKFLAPVGKISRQLPVFYNPVMKTNRDISVLIAKILLNKDSSVGLPLAGSGIRGLRLLKEAGLTKVFFNDINKDAASIIKKNLKINRMEATVSCSDANDFLLASKGFHYIDIDPFGSPNDFLDSAIKRLARGGLLAVTATDTAPLCGTYPKACKRKYWAQPRRGEAMHEYGLRILIRKIQLIGAQYDKALKPVYSFYKDHYFRVFFICQKSKTEVDKLLELHGQQQDIGPMWLGSLWDHNLAVEISKTNKFSSLNRFVNTIAGESEIQSVGYHDIHYICEEQKCKTVPSQAKVLAKLTDAASTHFCPTGIRTTATRKELINLIQQLV